jgi:hypothetical protein
MSIKVIGAGFGRTGTLSLKGALERLGFDPCYHMVEVMERTGHSDAWLRTAHSGKVDWSVFDGFQSVVDWPAVRYWRDLIERYPSAKVILTLRDPESWYKSVSDTIYTRITSLLPADAPDSDLHHRAMTTKVVLMDTFGGRFLDKAHAIDVFARHNAAVRESVDPSRLLVFHVKDGWEPLCRFLDRPVPDESFPRVNDTAEFLSRFAEEV